MTCETSIYEFAKSGLEKSSSKIAIWFEGKSITYFELFKKIDTIARHFFALGVRPGSVVTLHLPNCPQTVMAIYAIAQLGGICNLVHPLTPEPLLRENMADTESEIVISHLPMTGKCVLTMDCLSAYEKDSKKKIEIPNQASLAERCAFYLHSSGTTGKPKTVMLSHNAINQCVRNTSEFFSNEDVTLSALPISHIFGLTMDMHRSISMGSKLIQMSRWNSSDAVHLIRKHHVSAILAVPKMCYSLLSESSFSGPEVSQLKHCYVGGDTVDPQLIRDFDERVGQGHVLFPGFGMTETTINCVNRPEHYKAGSIGYPMRDTEIAVLGEDNELHPNGEGELVISSKTLMMGYLHDNVATENAMLRIEGKCWVRSGDLVCIDEAGFLFYKERLKNVIVHNGHKINPGDVEHEILKVAAVDTVCVVGVMNEHSHTEDVVAAVVLKCGTKKETAEYEIMDACANHLPKYSVPKYIRFCEALPVTTVGKLDRNRVKEFL